MFLKSIVLIIISFVGCCLPNDLNINKNVTSTGSKLERQTKASIVSFQPLGENIALGLDFLLPFIRVPILREVDVYGNEPALININSAALVSTGILAVSSALVSYIFKTYVIFGREETKSSDKNRRSDNDFENEIWSILNNFKLVYKNSSGARVDTSLSGLFETIDDTFQKNDIDLSSCIQKALCKRIQLSSRHVNEGHSSGVDKIIDGFTSLKWFKHLLRYTSFKDAIEARDISANNNGNPYETAIYCDVKYPKCKWHMPEDNLVDIIRTYLKFT